MEDDKRKKKNKKKKNKSNFEKTEGACPEESQGSHHLDDKKDFEASRISNSTKGLIADLGKDSHGFDGQETKDKNEVGVKPGTADREEKLQRIIELEGALGREVSCSESLRAQITSLEAQLAQCAVRKASEEDEIIKLQDEIRTHMQKEACKDDEIQKLKAERNSLLQKKDITEDEVKKLKAENLSLQKEMEEMKGSLEKLLQERQQLSSKLVAVQTGLQQLEREARVRARVEHDIAGVTTSEAPKRWLAWGSSKDPIAEAVGIAEESYKQKEAAASIIEKLVTENAELMEKINELRATVDHLNQKCNNLTESSTLHETAQEDATVLSKLAFKDKGTDGKLSNHPTVADQPATGISNRGGSSYIASGTTTVSQYLLTTTHVEDGLLVHDSDAGIGKAKQNNMASINPTTTGNVHNDYSMPDNAAVFEEPKQNVIVSKDPMLSGHVENGLSLLDSYAVTKEAKQNDMVNKDPATPGHEENGFLLSDSSATIVKERQNASDSVTKPPEINHTTSKKIVPLSDAPLMGAPIRLVSFLTRYVSGADLVKQQNSVSR